MECRRFAMKISGLHKRGFIPLILTIEKTTRIYMIEYEIKLHILCPMIK